MLPSRTGWKPGGKRAQARFETEYANWALKDFSGYITSDELYDGPFCILSLVDNHTFKRLDYQVLDHAANQADIIAFFQRFQARLVARQLSVQAITTDGSNLYPGAIQAVFGAVPHQVCYFHVLKDISKAVLHALAHVRKTLADKKPKRGRGRPAKADRAAARQAKRTQAKIADLFTHRHLFVQRHLTDSERLTVQRITRGLPHLRALRDIMDQVYQLFDRRCHTAAALAKLTLLRQRVRRFKKLGQALRTLFSANLEKALTFLDDRSLPSTSNAVERGNRRYRKMQNQVYRVRTLTNISARYALDLFRDAWGSDRQRLLDLLHQDRATSSLGHHL